MGPSLAGYTLGAHVRTSGERVVFEARRRSDGAAVAVETLAADYPGRDAVARLRRDATLARRLPDVDGVITVHAVERHGSGNLAMITEPATASLADELAAAAGPLDRDRVLGWALALVDTLEAVHERGIVHKAVTPENVRLAPAPQRGIRLTGFAIASELDHEQAGTGVAGGLEGPLAYLSPEQTGRMNRAVDYRADFYGLGVTLFELLTGERPFAADSVLAWIHQHISQPAPSLRERNPALDDALDRVIAKLLAKNPEARYQSAAGLRADLVHCREQRDTDNTAAFVPGRHDAAARFLLPQQLYGRDAERDRLMGYFEAVAEGASELCLVQGPSGVGKSALVSELDQPLVRERGFLVRGKFDQFQRGEAYSALASAFRGLVLQLLNETDAERERWREAIAGAAGTNAGLLVELLPDLELLLGPQPPVAELPPAEAQNRFQRVFLNVVRVFANQRHPLVVFIDDLQWSDTPTLQLLQRLVTAREVTHLLVIGAYRDNEVDAGHPLRVILAGLREQRPVRELALQPLDGTAVNRLVADALRTDTHSVAALAGLVHQRAQGNPFFTTQILHALHDHGAITFDTDRGRWAWDTEAAYAAPVSDDVVAFMVANLRRLPAATQNVLQLAACIGSRFDLRTLALIHERSAADAAGALMPALRQHAVVPLHGEYRLVPHADAADGAGGSADALNPAYRFQHDRIQQAAYALIDPDRRQSVHLSIGRLLRRNATDAERDERLMTIVGHLNAGRALITEAGERLDLARLNLAAGIRARRSAAYEPALEYLRVGESLLSEAEAREHPDLALGLMAEAQQAAYLTARFEEAETRMHRLLAAARTDLERAEFLAVRTRQYATVGKMQASIEAAMEGLELLGVPVTATPDQADVDRERRRVAEALGDRAIADLADAPTIEDRATLIAMRLLMEVFPAAFLSGTGALFPYLVIQAVNLGLRNGNCPEAAFAYAGYGMLLCGELDDPALGYEYGRLGLAINERFDDIALRSRVVYVYAMFIHHWSNHWSTLTPWFRKGIEAGYESGDLLYLAYSAQDCVIWDPTLDLETAAAEHACNMAIVRDCAYQDSLDSGTLFLQLQRNLLGRTDAPASLSDAEFDEHACLAGMRERGFMTGVANYHIYTAEAAFLHGDLATALVHIREQDGLVRSSMSLPQLVRYHVVAFLARASVARAGGDTPADAGRDWLLGHLAPIERWATNCAANFSHLAALMRAELAALDGARETALDEYEAAIEAARAAGFLRDEAMASERAAGYLLGLGRDRAAEGYLRGAYSVYKRWGAWRKAALLEQEHPFLRAVAEAERTQLEAPHATAISSDDIDLASVMKASRAISGELERPRLLEITLEILLENAGAQWGCLVSSGDDGLVAEASAAAGDEPQWEADPLDPLPPQAHVTASNGGRLAVPVTLLHTVGRTGEPVIVDDALDSPFADDPYVARRRPRSLLCVPLGAEAGSPIVYLENALTAGAFTAARVEVIQLLAAQAAVAISKAELYGEVRRYSQTLEEEVARRTGELEDLNRELRRLADHDGLTGLANRRTLDETLNRTWKRLRREGAPLSVVLVDVDAFKQFNDRNGHQAGDECLVRVARAIEGELRRPGDMLARYGGEEFLILLPSTDGPGAATLAERVRAAVAALGIPHNAEHPEHPVTISAGVAACVPDGQTEASTLIGQADSALYRAKAEGRNRVCMAEVAA